MIDEESAPEESGAPAWMATFADLATLMLTFFILLLTFAEMDIEKFKDALGSVQSELGGGTLVTDTLVVFTPIQADSLQPLHQPPPAPADAPGAGDASMQELARMIEAMVKERDLQDDVQVQSSARGVVVRVKGRLFFNPGTADLTRQSWPVLDQMGGIMNKFPYEISVEGHTDNVKITRGRYTSNWELSTARAYSTLEYLRKSGVDMSMVHISGFGDTRPVDTNDTEEGRARNRRVEFVFYRPDSTAEETRVAP
jgi:chemotaxis protein MotB